MLFEENSTINSNSFIKLNTFHQNLLGKNFGSSILIPEFYLRFQGLLENLISIIIKKEISNLNEVEYLKLSPNENGNILMENWKSALEFCQKTGLTSEYKFLVIENIESVSLNLANALLKILEEPPLKTFILLSYKNFKEILPTVKSRCITINIKNNKENFDLIYENFIKNPEMKSTLQKLCAYNIQNLSFFCSQSSIEILKSIEIISQNFSYVNFKNFFLQNSSKTFFFEICFLFIESSILQTVKKNKHFLSFYNFYFNKKYVKLYNINSEGFLYYTFYYICRN